MTITADAGWLPCSGESDVHAGRDPVRQESSIPLHPKNKATADKGNEAGTRQQHKQATARRAIRVVRGAAPRLRLRRISSSYCTDEPVTARGSSLISPKVCSYCWTLCCN